MKFLLLGVIVFGYFLQVSAGDKYLFIPPSILPPVPSALRNLVSTLIEIRVGEDGHKLTETFNDGTIRVFFINSQGDRAVS